MEDASKTVGADNSSTHMPAAGFKYAKEGADLGVYSSVSFNSDLNEEFDLGIVNPCGAIEQCVSADVSDSGDELGDQDSERDPASAALFEGCSEMFKVDSRGFKKCLKEKVELGQSCDFSNEEQLRVHHKQGKGMEDSRADVSQLFNQDGVVKNQINFLSLGLRGRVAVSCLIEGYPASTPVEGRVLSLKEITWGNQSFESYPEKANVRVKLDSCENEELNGKRTIASIKTNDVLEYSFDNNEEGLDFSGCRLSNLIIKDKSPKDGKSKDGIDLNSFALK